MKEVYGWTCSSTARKHTAHSQKRGIHAAGGSACGMMCACVCVCKDMDTLLYERFGKAK